MALTQRFQRASMHILFPVSIPSSSVSSFILPYIFFSSFQLIDHHCRHTTTIAATPPPGRKGSLLIGSTKSNTGHQEPASGLVGLAKVLIAMHSGTIPPNLHFQQPNPNIAGLVDGRLKVSFLLFHLPSHSFNSFHPQTHFNFFSNLLFIYSLTFYLFIFRFFYIFLILNFSLFF